MYTSIPSRTLGLSLLLAAIFLLSIVPRTGGMQNESDKKSGEKIQGFASGDIHSIRKRAGQLDHLKTLIVSRNDRNVIEYYARGYSPDSELNIKSASKSVLSALVGRAIKDGHLEGINREIRNYFPDILSHESELKQAITLRNLLLMKSGLQSTSFDNYGPWVVSNNWLRNALERPMIHRPGEDVSYSTGNSHIIAAILTEVIGRDLRDYAQDRLFDPLHVEIERWQRSPEGYRFGGNNLFLTPRGMLRFGQLYLNDGEWKGRQIISEDWVDVSTDSLAHETYNGYPYGYFWWNTNYHGLHVDFAWGHGGQYVFIVPERDLVIVSTSDLHNIPSTDGYTEKVHRLLETKILPAADPIQKRPERGYLFDWL